MIIRKPYAFLIKNFKKIHIFLFALCAYILYKTTQLYSFMKEFVTLGTYDAYNEPISKYTTVLAYIFLLLIIASMITILIVLRKKNKPWKMYIVPVITYCALFFTFIFTTNFFATYTGSVASTTPRAIRDITLILIFPQYFTFIVLIIRILGLDLNKFDFKSDAEFLELSEDDRDEMEINIDIDKASFKRFFARLKRNTTYYYIEHKKTIYILIALLTLFIGYKSYVYIFVTNKSYTEGENINTNGYEIKINNSYYSSLDYKGDAISKENNFVILDVTITNNGEKREINFDRFHVMNATSNYSPTSKTYETQFQDLGTAYDTKTINNGEKYNTLLIYKVKAKEDIKRFVLYYQEFNNNNTNHLRKIKLKLQNLSKVEEKEALSLYDTLTVNIGTSTKEVIIDNYEIADSVSYNKESCSTKSCTYEVKEQTAPIGYKILKLDFASNDFGGKDMIDFLTMYGKINYMNNNGEAKGTKIENALPTLQYYGKYVYLKVPNEISEATSIELIVTVRNNKYKYKLK